MVFGWRRAFCTSVPREPDSDSIKPSWANNNNTPKTGGRFVFFSSSSSSTPRLHVETDSGPNLRCRTRTTTATVPEKSASVPVSPKLHCKTTNSPKLFQWSSTPSSPSTFSLLKANLRFSTNNRCGLCSQSVKRGRGVAIFTAECSHSFHFPCIAGHVKEKGTLACPICGTVQNQTSVLSVNDIQSQNHQFAEKLENDVKVATMVADDDVDNKRNRFTKQNSFKPDLKVYNDDEPIACLTPKGRFNPIPESDENCDDEDSNSEFQGFHIDGCSNGSNSPVDIDARGNGPNGDVEVRLLPEAAVISTGRGYETYVIALRAKAPPVRRTTTRGRAPIDLVTVIDVSGKMSNEKLKLMKRTMRIIISSLTSSDRLSIVAFSSYSKRLLHLKRMTASGQRAARRIVDAMAILEGSSSATDAVKKAAKVLEDRREKNTVASIFLLSDVSSQSSYVSTTRYCHSQSHLNIVVHSLKLTSINEHAFAKSVTSLLTIPIQDLQLQLGFVSGSAPAEITSVFSYAPRPVTFGFNTGTSTVRIGELCAVEEREMLIELKVPSSGNGAHQVLLSVRCSYRDSVTQDVIYCNEHALVVPRPHTVRSSSNSIQRLRNLFITTRALAESRLLTARNDHIGAYHKLILARATLHQTSSGSSEFVVSLEAELNELQRRRQAQAQVQAQTESAAFIDEKGEPLTPISAWRVAEKLAKVAIMRKTLNRVSDLHGFENARF
ncbi:E3 ubiquitin-protein ligase WAVH1-like [Bidens hawaiensis]|uniref:E3 ubiquitin-protein ligase WAVH1-like n=1 Tax=Bidens hawaiensis TaxID=980011 RepID=UPI004049F6A3